MYTKVVKTPFYTFSTHLALRWPSVIVQRYLSKICLEDDALRGLIFPEDNHHSPKNAKLWRASSCHGSTDALLTVQSRLKDIVHRDACLADGSQHDNTAVTIMHSILGHTAIIMYISI